MANRADPFASMGMFALALILSCACAKAPPAIQPHAQQCGGVEILALAPEFENSLDVQYGVSATGERFCVPALDYAFEVTEAFAVVVVRSDDDVPATVDFSLPLIFQRARKWKDKANPFRYPRAIEVATGGPVYDVPPGKYRMLLRYRKGDCAGKKFTAACVAKSEPFLIRESQEFTIER